MNQNERRIKHPYLFLLVFLILLLVSYPYLESHLGTFAFSLVMISIVLSCLYSVSGKRSTFWTGIILATPSLLERMFGGALAHGLGLDLLIPHNELFALPLYLYIVYNILKDILSHEKVSSDTIRGAVCLYILLGIIWSSLYLTVYEFDHSAFRGVQSGAEDQIGHWREFLYFSFVTLTTLGYGDISPVSDSARSLVIVEAVSGTLFIAIMISKLVSLYGHRGSVGQE